MNPRPYRLLIPLALGLLAGACSQYAKPLDPADIASPDEIPPGPGLLSGEDGEFSTDVKL